MDWQEPHRGEHLRGDQLLLYVERDGKLAALARPWQEAIAVNVEAEDARPDCGGGHATDLGHLGVRQYFSVKAVGGAVPVEQQFLHLILPEEPPLHPVHPAGYPEYHYY